MRFKVSKLNIGSMSKTATLAGDFKGKKIEVYLTNSNSSWYDHSSKFKAVGDELEIDDEQVRQNPETGRYYLERVTAAKALQIATMTKAIATVKSASAIIEE